MAALSRRDVQTAVAWVVRAVAAGLFLPLVLAQACADDATGGVDSGDGASQSGRAIEPAPAEAAGGGASAAFGGESGGGRLQGVGGRLCSANAGTPFDGGTGGADGGLGEAGAPLGAAGERGANGGTEPAVEPLIINKCAAFVNATADAAKRSIAWDYALGSDPGRCLMINVGQSVTWTGPLSTHPLQPADGTTPSPVLADYPPDATSHTITFPLRGTFGFVCGSHSTMNGAIKVAD